jgi:NSS family neurotransmitter:Na+ symporter
VVSYFVDERRWSRRKSVLAIGAFTFAVGLPSAMSSGTSETLTNMQAFGQTGFLSIMDFIWGNLSLAIGGLLLSIFIGWVWGVRNAGAEFRRNTGMSDAGVATWGFFIRWVCPIVIFVVLLNVFGVV